MAKANSCNLAADVFNETGKSAASGDFSSRRARLTHDHETNRSKIYDFLPF